MHRAIVGLNALATPSREVKFDLFHHAAITRHNLLDGGLRQQGFNFRRPIWIGLEQRQQHPRQPRL